MDAANAEDDLRKLEVLCRHPQETALNEFKAAISFQEKSHFAAKLVKQILGHANAGGGNVFIGFRHGPSGALADDPDLNDTVGKSYETTRLCQYVQTFLHSDDRISLRVHHVSHAGKDVPVISIDGFSRHPHFCAKRYRNTKGDDVTEEGALYLRLPSAKTVKVTTPAEWTSLIDVCVRKRHDEFLVSFSDLLESIGTPVKLAGSLAAQPLTTNPFETWLTRNKERANDEFKKLAPRRGLLEVIHWPLESRKTWTQGQLLDAMRRAECRNTGWPMGAVLLNNPDLKPKPDADGIWASLISSSFSGKPSFDYWALHTSGAFLMWRGLEEDEWRDPNTALHYDWRICAITEVFLHASKLYKELGLQGKDRVSLEIVHLGLAGRILSAGDRQRAWGFGDAKAQVNTSEWRQALSLDEITAGLDALVCDIVRKVFVLFDFIEIQESVIKGILRKFAARSV